MIFAGNGEPAVPPLGRRTVPGGPGDRAGQTWYAERRDYCDDTPARQL